MMDKVYLRWLFAAISPPMPRELCHFCRLRFTDAAAAMSAYAFYALSFIFLFTPCLRHYDDDAVDADDTLDA